MATFSDTQLIQIVIKAARRINRRLCLVGTTDEITIDSSNGEFVTPTGDDAENLTDLVLLQAECLLASREFSEDLRDGSVGTLVEDGEQKVDTRTRGDARGIFFNSGHSPCEELKEAIKFEKLNRSGNSGKMVW